MLMAMLAILLSLVVAQPVWATTSEGEDKAVKVTAPVQHLQYPPQSSTEIDQLLREQRALSARVTALEAATTESRTSNEHWLSISIALLGLVTFIHALRLRRLK